MSSISREKTSAKPIQVNVRFDHFAVVGGDTDVLGHRA